MLALLRLLYHPTLPPCSGLLICTTLDRSHSRISTPVKCFLERQTQKITYQYVPNSIFVKREVSWHKAQYSHSDGLRYSHHLLYCGLSRHDRVGLVQLPARKAQHFWRMASVIRLSLRRPSAAGHLKIEGVCPLDQTKLGSTGVNSTLGLL